ncbi:hypothetical protein COE70_30095, partial [Bacillus cereus]
LQGPPGTEGPTGPTGPTGPIFPDSRLNAKKSALNTSTIIPSGGIINQFDPPPGSVFANLNFNTATGIVTITIPGVYVIFCSISVATISNTPALFKIVFNNNPSAEGFETGATTAGNVISIIGTNTLNIGDTIDIRNISATPITLIGPLASPVTGTAVSSVLFTVYRFR